MITPWQRPKQKKAASKPLAAIMFWMGATVSAEPAPNPAAVKPGGEAALVREPLQRVADAGAVDAARADAGDDLGDVVEWSPVWRMSS